MVYRPEQAEGTPRVVTRFIGRTAGHQAMRHAACVLPNPEIVAHLFARGACINVRSADGRTLMEFLGVFRGSATLLRAAMNA